MQTCSNCGAAARPGAKFCTSCGARLPIVATGENQGWGASGNDESQQTSAWGQAPANGQRQDAAAPVSPDQPDAITTASAESDEQSAAPATAWSQPDADQGAEPAPANEQPAVSASPSWSWGQPQTDEATTTQDETGSTTDEGQSSAGEEHAESSGGESSWISSWSSPTPGGEATTAEGQDDGAIGETMTSASDATDAGATDTDATAETDDEAIASEQHETTNEDPDARPEWMRNLTASQEDADGAATTAETETAEEAPADRAGENEDIFGASAPTGDQTSTPETGHEWETDDAAVASESEAIISSSLSDESVTDETGTVQDLTGDQTGATSGTAEQAQPANAPATAETSPTSADGGTASEPAAVETPDVAVHGAPASTAGGDTLGEAESLLDRLRELLPALAASGAAQPATTGVGGIADQLQQAANENAKPEFDDLRSVLEAAKERPRDVDTMLNLVAKIDPMLDLLHAHGNLLDAITSAVQQLRDDQQQ